jgi:hypothetical protein
MNEIFRLDNNWKTLYGTGVFDRQHQEGPHVYTASLISDN